MAEERSGDHLVEPSHPPAPLSFAQLSLWFLDVLAHDSGSRTGVEYLDPVLLRVRGPLDTRALRDAFEALATRHAALRTRYVIVDGEPRQVVDDEPRPEHIYRDLTLIPGEERQHGSTELVEKELKRPFDLSRDHPFRTVSIRLSADEHVVLIVLHHIASDAWSRSIIARELAELYADRSGMGPAKLAPTAMEYTDFAAWQRERLAGAARSRLSAYWRDRLAGLQPVELPTDRKRTTTRDAAGSVVTFTMSPSLFRRLDGLGRSQRCTPFMTLLAGYFALLARYSGQQDLAVGTPTAGRDRVEAEDIVGYFINMLVMRVDLTGDPSFRELLGRVRDSALGAFAHKEMPFEKLVEELSPDRDPAISPLFQMAFVWQNAPQARFTLPNLDVEPLRVGATTAKFDLTLRLTKKPDGTLAGELEYASQLFDEATVVGLADHYIRLLERAVETPDAPVGRRGLLTRTELAALSAPEPVGPRATLPGMFERQAAETPEAVAVSHEGVELSYRELDQRANRLARLLRARGVGAGTLVGVHAEPSIDLIVALVAIVKAGGGYLPIDPSWPASRTAAVLDDADPVVVLGPGRSLESLRHTRPTMAWERLELRGQADETPGGLSDDVEPDHLAYVIFTSGSTGRPKGVLVTHANVVRLFAVARPHFAFGADDVWTLFHSAAFDFSVWEIWGALLHGGRLVVVPAPTTRSPEAFADLLVRERVSVLNQTPSAFAGLRDVVLSRDIALDDLRLVIFGGEALEVDRLAPWFDRFGDERPAMVNMYGITETTVHVTHRRLSTADLGRRYGPIGQPLDDLRVILMDEAMNPVPDGMPAEIYVAGPGLARGYLNRPELTAQRFVPDPFDARPGARLYRTGDLARRRAGGDLEYLGRVDDQVKIRGFRIELGEIEATLAAHPAVADCAVAVHEPRPGTQQLVAYVVTAPGAAFAAAGMREYLTERLPGYMVPALYVNLPALPRTTGGKLHRKALPAPSPTRVDVGTAQGYVAPNTARQIAIARVWSTVLGLDKVGVDDNFFEFGGDSIRAVRLVGALRDEGWPVTVEMLFRHRTVGGLCEALQTQHRDSADEAAGISPFALINAADRAMIPADVQDAYPLSLTQAGMLFEMMASPDISPYHNVVSYPVRGTGEFSETDLRRAIDIMVERNEILRTSFDLVTFEEPVQLVHRSAEVPLTVHDLRGLDTARARDAVTGRRRSEVKRLFDPSRPPLLRVHADVLTRDQWILTLTESHAILDGWSHHSLVNELLHLYRDLRNAAAQEKGAQRSPSVRFADFIALEQQALRNERSREFWRSRIMEFPRIELLRPDQPIIACDDRGHSVLRHERVSFADIEPQLRALANAEGLPFKTVLLTAHLTALATFTDKERFMTGLVCNGRPEVRDGDRVRGMFLNTVPFGANVTGTCRELLRAVYSEELALWPHRRYPLSAMQQDWGQRDRLLTALFSYMDFHVLDRRLVDLDGTVKLYPVEFPLQVTTEPGVLIVSGRSDRMVPEEVRFLAAHHRRALEALAESHPDDGPLPRRGAE